MKGVDIMVYDMLYKASRGEDQVYNGVPFTAGGIIYLYVATYFHEVAAIGGRLYADGREEELEPG